MFRITPTHQPLQRSLRRTALCAVLLPALLLGACNTAPSVAQPPSQPITALPTAPAPHPLGTGLYELTIAGIGTGQLQAKVGLGTQGTSLGAQDLSEVGAGLSFTPVSSGTFDQAGVRYLQASFRVKNNTGRNLQNLAFIPVNTDDADSDPANNTRTPTIGSTALSGVFLYDGSAASEATASSISLTNAKTTDAAGNVVNASTGGAYTTGAEYAAVTVTPPAGLNVTPLSAAWVVGDVNSSGEVLVTFAASFPVNTTDGKLNPYKFNLVFTAASDTLSAAQQRDLAFTAGLHPAANPSDANWLGQAVARGTDGIDYLVFKAYSANATDMQVEVKDASGAGRSTSLTMQKDAATNIWYATAPLAKVRTAGATTPATGLFDAQLTYGLRAWGPNWPKDAAWTPGTAAGFISDVDSSGHRFNPNKLLLDPYALEITRDYQTETDLGGERYTTGADHRNTDTGPYAPRGYVALTRNTDWATLGTQATTGRITRPQKDDVIYEVHVRGLTKQDSGVTATLQGTYAGAAQKAAYLKELGVTTVEFLPTHETENDANDATGGTRAADTTTGDNYWGYMTTNFFAPDRRYSSDQTAGGPTREFAQMVQAFRSQGIKVLTDVVYNHTGEGGLWNTADPSKLNLWSFRGLDNTTYYLLSNNKLNDYDITGTGNTMNTRHPQVQKLIIDSLSYQRNVLGVDGFRFDLGIALGNTYDNTTNPTDTQRFWFSGTDSNTALAKVAQAFPNVLLSSEPWGLAPGDQGYQLGKFPAGWSEWNGQFRDYFRRKQNKLLVAGKEVTPGQLISRFAGSSDLFGDAGDDRKPWNSINFINVHDGFTLKDVYSCNGKNNGQAWPLGISDGGTNDEDSWDNGSNAALQRQQARNAMMFLTFSQGVPIFNGGDEFLRSLNCNNNPYNLDSSGNWLNWTLDSSQQQFRDFTKAALNFRLAHPALRRDTFFTGTDGNGNGFKDITWLKADGTPPDDAWFNNTSEHALAFVIDGTEQGDDLMYVAYNGWQGNVNFTLPSGLPDGLKWYRVADTASWAEGTLNQFNAQGVDWGNPAGGGGTYGLNPRSVVVMIAKP